MSWDARLRPEGMLIGGVHPLKHEAPGHAMGGKDIPQHACMQWSESGHKNTTGISNQCWHVVMATHLNSKSAHSSSKVWRRSLICEWSEEGGKGEREEEH